MDFVVICRAYKPGTLNDLAAGNHLGHNCVLCTQPLQVTPQGVWKIKAGGRSFCNRCGFEFVNRIGARNLAGVILSDEARQQLDRIISQMRERKVRVKASA